MVQATHNGLRTAAAIISAINVAVTRTARTGKPEHHRFSVCPDVAKSLLDRIQYKENGDPFLQRRQNKLTARLYANEMLNGRWNDGSGPIVISNTGFLLDGQHRALAVIMCGQAVEFDFKIGVTEECAETIDTGQSRNPTQIARMTGSLDGANVLSRVGALRSFVFGWKCRERRLSAVEMKEMLEKYGHLIDDAISLVDRQLARRSVAIIGAVARALYHEDREKVARFCEILGDEPHQPDEVVARDARKFLHKVINGRGSASIRRQVYRKLTAYLKVFCAGEVRSRIADPPEEIYPITEIDRVEHSLFAPVDSSPGAGEVVGRLFV